MKKQSVWSRLLALTTSLLLAVALMSGCGKDPEESTQSTYESTVITTTDETGASETSETEASGSQTNDESTNSKATSTKKPASNTTKPTSGAKLDITTAAMPTRNLKNKTVTMFSWEPLSAKYSKPKSMPNMYKKEFKVTIKEEVVDHNNYWNELKTRKAAGNMPDLVKMPNWKYYPQPIVDGLVQPLDSFIDFGNPIWNDSSKSVREQYIWKGKTYIPVNSVNLDAWVFFNKKMMRDAGVSKNPEQLYKDGNWTYATFADIAKKTTIKDRATGKVTQAGLVLQTGDLIASTGLELIAGDGKGGAVNNLGHTNVTKFMNLMYDLRDTLYVGDQRTGFASSKVAMIVTQSYSATVEFNDLRLAGNLGWVPMPKQDKKSKNYLQTAISPGYGIAQGSKNPEAAALYIEYEKWFSLGSPVYRI
ncbi:MAG TPA: hypothetical protein DEP23_15435 [Ruminococcaceae bacterium]|nr:hypothetical protein [Oscillospiraceae bacterium]